MNELPIFTAALGIESPWYIKQVYFEEIDSCSQLFIEVAHTRRTKFKCQGAYYWTFLQKACFFGDKMLKTYRKKSVNRKHFWVRIARPSLKMDTSGASLPSS
ncbi:MAG: hypothetical protein RIS89_159 [Bacteroidota bacterium]